MAVDDFIVFRCTEPYLPITMSFLMDFTVGLAISVKAAIRAVDAFEILLFKFYPCPCVHAKQETHFSRNNLANPLQKWQGDQTESIREREKLNLYAAETHSLGGKICLLFNCPSSNTIAVRSQASKWTEQTEAVCFNAEAEMTRLRKATHVAL